jgi:hypothetical protein
VKKKNIGGLKSCPICGTKATYICEPFADKYGYGVICKRTGCLILPAVYPSSDSAMKEWNKTAEVR